MNSDKKARKGITRRDFFRGAAVAGATLAGAGALSGVVHGSGSGKQYNKEDAYEPIPIPVNELNEYGKILEEQLLLKSSPIAIKMLKDESGIPAGAKKPSDPASGIGGRLALCQGFALARRQRQTIAMFDTDHWCFEPVIAFGLRPPPETYLAGLTTFPFLIADKEAAAKHAREDLRLPYEKYKGSGMAMGPANMVNFSPDLIMIYCNPDQLRYLTLALGYKEAYMVNSSFYGIGSCGRAAVPPLLKGEATIAVTDLGERERAMVGEDKIVLTLPATTWQLGKGKSRNLFKDLMEGIDHFKDPLPYKSAFSPTMMPDFLQPGFYVDFFKEWGLWP
jgi:uncharacterized protein (DUF169 family)